MNLFASLILGLCSAHKLKAEQGIALVSESPLDSASYANIDEVIT